MGLLSHLFGAHKAEKPKQYSAEALVTNSKPGPIEVWFEPWGMTHPLSPGEGFLVVAISNQPGDFEIVEEPLMTAIYAWNGCTMKVYKDSKLIEDFNIALPDLPPGMSSSSFIRMIFGGPGGPARS